MDGLHPNLLALLTGFLSGILLCLPVGPVNLMVLNEGARRGFKTAMLISAGATLMECVYCFIAFSSFASFFTKGAVKAAMELVSFLFMLYLGIRFLRAPSVNAPVELGKVAHQIEERIEEKLHPHSAFMTGFVAVLGNVGVLVFWVVLAANFISREWVVSTWPGKLSCVAGVALGVGGWFAILSWGASRGHGRLSDKTLLRMAHFSGFCLLALACVHGVRIIVQLTHHTQTVPVP